MDECLDFIIDSMCWSFSRLNSFYNCPYEWRRKYIDCEVGESGFFAEFGSLCHSLLERFLKGELSIFEISQKYDEEFNEVVVHDAPPNKFVDIRQSYYDKGLEYFNNFDMMIDEYDILGVEKKVEFEIYGKPFVGYIDLLLRRKADGAIIILDHKSASLKFKKDGEVSKTDAEHFLEFKRQLYLYSMPVIKEYGKVDLLEWNLFRDQKIKTIEWKREEYNEAIKWAEDTIKAIENEHIWNPNPDYYYCHYLCSQRNNCCEYKP